MRYLLDTHTFLWFIDDHPNLSKNARSVIEDDSNEIFLSIASLWEIAIKVSLGKLQIAGPLDLFISQQLDVNAIQLLPILIEHITAIISLPFHHRDPFDRLLIAQSLVETMPLISADQAFAAYSISLVW